MGQPAAPQRGVHRAIHSPTEVGGPRQDTLEGSWWPLQPPAAAKRPSLGSDAARRLEEGRGKSSSSSSQHRAGVPPDAPLGLTGSWSGVWVLQVPGAPSWGSCPAPTPLPPPSHPCPSFLPPRDEVQMRTAYSKSNGQPKSLGSAPPGPGQVPLSSPTRGGVKKVSGVGGTTYEISV